MYIRTTARKNKDGSRVEYLQLAHNYWDPVKKRPRPKVIANLGRKDRLDLDRIRDMIRALSKLLPANEAAEIKAMIDAQGLPFKVNWAKSAGGLYFLRELWKAFGLKEFFEEKLQERRFEMPVEVAIFAMVAGRALAPESKLSTYHWIKEEAYFPEGEALKLHHFYRAMDFLVEVGEGLEEELFKRLAHLFNLKVDLIFFDTTSVYFETEVEDDLRKRGYSRDRRPDLPQVVIGLAVTREGIPVKAWVFPGDTPDVKTVFKVQEDLKSFVVGRIIWVCDRGMVSEETRVVFQRAGGGYILGERLRSGSEMVEEVLATGGRYRKVKENLWVKEIRVRRGAKERRYVLVYNPERAAREKAIREETLEVLREELERIKGFSGSRREKAVCRLRSNPVLRKYLAKDGLRIDKEKVRREERLDGKYLLSTTEEDLSAEEVALSYRNLQEVERAFWELKHRFDIRPMYHRVEERIKGHVMLCWLALLMGRLVELKTGESFSWLRRKLGRIHVVELEYRGKGKKEKVYRWTEMEPQVMGIFRRLGIKLPQAYEFRLSASSG
jgi:hypothetical protein